MCLLVLFTPEVGFNSVLRDGAAVARDLGATRSSATTEPLGSWPQPV